MNKGWWNVKKVVKWKKGEKGLWELSRNDERKIEKGKKGRMRRIIWIKDEEVVEMENIWENGEKRKCKKRIYVFENELF